MQLVPKSQHTIGNSFWNTLHYAFRGQYGRAGLSAFAVIPVAGYLASAIKIQKHHVIPNAVFKKYAADLNAIGWIQDAGLNLKKLPFPFHANHPSYSRYVMAEIDALKASRKFDASSMKSLMDKLRQEINTIHFDANFKN